MSLTVAEIWRYPVKSFGGESLTSTQLTDAGVPYDRHWAIRDLKSEEILGGRTTANLMCFSARFCEEPTQNKQIAEIMFPDGSSTRTDDLQINARLSSALGRKVELSALRDVSDTAYYQRPQSFEFTPGVIRRAFGLEGDESLTDLSGDTEASAAYIKSWETNRTRPGTHFDTSTLHILTEASLRYIQALMPGEDISVRRFRPNILVADEANMSAPIEFDWIDKEFSIGSARVEITWETVRCIMTTRAQSGLPKAAKVLRTLVKNTKQNLGVCAEVRGRGRLAIGDSVEEATQ